MLRRASDLAARARERIRAAREHDPHGWHERDDDRAILVHDDEPIDFVEIPDDDPSPRTTTPAPPRPRSAAPNPAPPTSTAPSARAASAGRRRAAARTGPASARAG